VKILLFGANGQVGWELQRSLCCLGELLVFDRHTANFEQPDKLRDIIRRQRPSHIVNAAAYTAVDKAETEQEEAHRINTEAVDLLAHEAKRLNAMLIHYSTDYVFDGNKSNSYLEDDATKPINVYGKTKLKGEEAIQDSGCDYLIFRTSWVYSTHGSNFAKTILGLAQEREMLNIVHDQHGVPTSAQLISEVTALCMHRLMYDKNPDALGSEVYHLAPSGKTTWYGFAKYLLEETLSLGGSLRTSLENIKPITTDEFPLPAKRPISSLLNTSKLATSFDITMPPWEWHVRRLAAELLQRNS